LGVTFTLEADMLQMVVEDMKRAVDRTSDEYDKKHPSWDAFSDLRNTMMQAVEVLKLLSEIPF